MLLTVSVTRSHINQGSPGGHACPIALALTEFLVPGTKVDVGYNHVSIHRPDQPELDRDTCIYLPQSTLAFILDFDSEQSVEPLKFSLEIPEHLLPYLKSKT